MDVFIVLECVNYEGDCVIGAFKTKARAQAVALAAFRKRIFLDRTEVWRLTLDVAVDNFCRDNPHRELVWRKYRKHKKEEGA